MTFEAKLISLWLSKRSDRYFSLHSAIILIIKRVLWAAAAAQRDENEEGKIYLSSRQKHFSSRPLRDFHSLISIDTESDETQILFIVASQRETTQGGGEKTDDKDLRQDDLSALLLLLNTFY